MKQAKLSFNKIWKDEVEELYQVEIAATNGRFAAQVDDYYSLEDLALFGQELIAFPKDLSHQVLFRSGKEDENGYTYVFFRAHTYNKRGHAALDIQIRVNGDSPHSAASHFSIVTEVASLNKFGQELSKWAMNDEAYLEFSFSGPI